MYQRYLVGSYGESLTQLIFSALGHKAEKPKEYGCGDLIVDDHICIEVKTANRGKDGKWRFTLEKHGHRGITSDIQFVILIAITNGYPVFFIIPADDIRGRRQIAITSSPEAYSGIFAPYRYSWSSILGELK